MNYMLASIRRDAVRTMTGRCDVTRGDWPDESTVGSNVRCAVRPSLRANTEASVGGDQVALHVYDVRVPWDLDVERGDVVTVTVSDDPQLVGRHLTVVEVSGDEWGALRILICHESRV